MDPALLATIVDAAEDLMIDRYANTAGAVVWFYDYLLTASAEYKYIWKKKWSLVKILYLLNRYLTPPFLTLVLYHLDGEQRDPLSVQLYARPVILIAHNSLTRSRSCIFYDITVTILRAIQLLVSTWLILIVVQSLSLNNRSFKYFICLVFLATNILAAVFAGITLKEMYPTIEFLAPFNVCYSNTPDSTRWLYLSQVPFDVLLLAIELYYYWRLHRLIAPAQPTRLIAAMYLDGVWYFVATITVKLAAGLVIIFAASTYWYIATSADQAFTSTFIARLVLHLRSVASPSSATTYTDTSPSHMFTGASIDPKIMVTMPGTDQGHDFPEHGVHPLEHQRGHDDESGFGEHSVSDDQWRHGEDDALEMNVRVKKKSPSTSTCVSRR